MKNHKREKASKEKKRKHLDLYAAAISMNDLEEYNKTIVSKIVTLVSQRFTTNMRSIANVALLPVLLVYHGVSDTSSIERFRRAMMKGELPDDKEKAKKIIEQRMKKMDKQDDLDWSFSILDSLVEDEPELIESIQNAHKQNILSLWTTFEVLASDLWIEAVNEFPSKLGMAAFKKRKERMSGIIVKSFLESGFRLDMSGDFGNAVAVCYDFSGVADIAHNYRTVFGKVGKSIHNELKNNKELILLQALRNIIIHNGGIIDKVYSGLTGNDSILGSNITVKGKDVMEYGKVVLEAGIGLMKFVDEWVVKRESS